MVLYEALLEASKCHPYIFKEGDKRDQENYCPVSLTSLVCKALENVIISQIIKHLESNEILAYVRYGFRFNHSCEAQLFLTVDNLTGEIRR